MSAYADIADIYRVLEPAQKPTSYSACKVVDLGDVSKEKCNMAGEWSRDGAVQDQIDDTISDAVRAARARMPSGEGSHQCEYCGDRIPDRRRQALPGTHTCVRCQSERDKTVAHSTINRRGSKDSQLR